MLAQNQKQAVRDRNRPTATRRPVVRASAGSSSPARAPLPAPASSPVRAASPATIARMAASAQRPAAAESHSLSCVARAIEFESLASTNMFENLGGIRAEAAANASLETRAPRTIAEARGYTQEELFGLAEIAYHYLRSGGFKLAAVIFEGLSAVEPKEPYFALAMGLTADRMGDRAKATTCFERAQRLDPRDGRADVNLAELSLDGGDRKRAIALLHSGAKKAHATRDCALENKALAMLELLGAR